MAARGGLLKLLDAYIAIGGDASDFDKVVDQSEAKAKAAGGRLESAFSPRKVLGALGAAAGLAFGVALTEGANLNNAMSELKRSTGMVGAEADKAQASLANMYSRNLQGFDEIGAVMATVYTGFGLTGAAADALTQKFLSFGTSSIQSASSAASYFDLI